MKFTLKLAFRKLYIKVYENMNIYLSNECYLIRIILSDIDYFFRCDSVNMVQNTVLIIKIKSIKFQL